MVPEKLTTPAVEPAAAVRSARTSRRWLGWLFIVLSAVGVGVGFVFVGTLLWPTELEQEIRLDLLTKGEIDEGTRVSVVNELRLFSFYSRFGPQRFATLCLQDPDGSLHLAYARCWREGMLWHTDSDRWKSLTAWPSTEEIRTFEDAQADVVAPALESGYLPRPPGTEGFQLTHVSVEVSPETHGFEANRNVDPILLAAALRNGVAPGSFTLAQFHEPHWHSSRDGIEAIEKSIEYLHRIVGRAECRAMDCESLLEVLHAVKERLLRADELKLKFYFLGTDRSTE
jgi:hypothetical protein